MKKRREFSDLLTRGSFVLFPQYVLVVKNYWELIWQYICMKCMKSERTLKNVIRKKEDKKMFQTVSQKHSHIGAHTTHNLSKNETLVKTVEKTAFLPSQIQVYKEMNKWYMDI